LEGNRLLDHEFTHGAKVHRVWGDGRLTLRLVTDDYAWQELPRDERTTVAGSAARPIIDIATVKVAETFRGERVNVTYRQGRITITEQEG
jgi:hypothetical protein